MVHTFLIASMEIIKEKEVKLSRKSLFSLTKS